MPQHSCNRVAREALLGLAAILTAAALPAAAFEAVQDGVYADRIDWGMTIDMSGPASTSQRPWGLGFQAALKAVNEAGGVHGRKVNVLAEDGRYDATNERVLYEKFAGQTPALGVSGVGNSSAQVALVPLIKRAKLPVVGTYTTARQAIEPPFPLFYGGFCGFKEMAQVSVGFFTEHLKLERPKVALVHLDVASGKEYVGYVEEAVKARNGTLKAIPIKVVAADATPQVLEIQAMKPDYVVLHGVGTTSTLVMKAMQQHGITAPAVAITYLGTPSVYQSLGPEAGKNYYFVSCFSPASSDPRAAAAMSAGADRAGQSEFKDDINYVAGWVIGNMVAQALAKVGPEPTRDKLAAMLNAGFTADTAGLASQLSFTPTDHAGLTVLKPFKYDYDAKVFQGFGSYGDYARFVK